jgi:hypothetical protein
LVTAPGEQKELEELRFLLVSCCQQFDDFFELVGANSLLRVLNPICLFERPSNFPVVEKDVEEIDPVRDRPGNVARPSEMGNVVEDVPPVNQFEILLRTNGGQGVQGASVGIQGLPGLTGGRRLRRIDRLTIDKSVEGPDAAVGCGYGSRANRLQAIGPADRERQVTASWINPSRANTQVLSAITIMSGKLVARLVAPNFIYRKLLTLKVL